MDAPLGEFELIAAIRERIERAGAPAGVAGLVLGSGDDAAVTVRDGASVITVDALIEGVHFRIPPFELRSVGHKALAVALSDLAAMGASPCEAYVQLGVRDGLGEHEVLALADGVGTLAAAHQVAVAGGDVTRAPALLLAVTAVGQAAEPEALVRRRGARPGDAPSSPVITSAPSWRRRSPSLWRRRCASASSSPSPVSRPAWRWPARARRR